MEKKVKKCENVENDQNEKRKEKIVFSPLTCDTFQCFQPLADEEPRQNSDPNELVELKPEDSTGRILRTGDPINSGPVPGCSARGTSVEDQGRPTGLLNSTVEQMNESVVSIIGKVKNHQVEAMIDSGSTGNFVSLQLVEQCELKKENHQDFLTLADGTRLTVHEVVKFHFKCGFLKNQITAQVFPGMHQSLILGIPWLRMVNPHINWSERTITVKKGDTWEILPQRLKRQSENVRLLTAKQMQSLIRRRSQSSFVGIIRQVSECMGGEREMVSDSGMGKLMKKIKQPEIQQILEKYSDIFPEDLPSGIPPKRMGHEFRIDLEDDTPPVHRPLYKMSPLELEEAKKQIKYMMDHEYIRPSDSPYGAPVLFAPKKDGSLRFCIDYRWLNKKTIRNRYPLPLPEELYDRLGSSTVFSKIDLRSGYWQMPVRTEDVPKTAFKTRWGLYECLVLPFGVTNAPAQFMNLMNDVLRDYLDKFVIVFLDDILIYSKTINDHLEHLRLVLDKLRKYKLFAKASKCLIAQDKIEFLGQMITEKGMCPVDEKLRAVKEWDEPQHVKGVRSFLGFANYYRRYVRNFAEIANPLTELTKKDQKWHWGSDEQEAFQKLKIALCQAPFLVYPDPALPYTVVTDASGIAVGGVLMQDHGSGLQPLAFLSRKLKPSEQKYSAYERELAAVTYCLINWRHYIEGCPGGITVITDHKPLTNLMDQSQFTRAQMRWVRLGLFQSINPTIKYQPGKANIVADALSRSVNAIVGGSSIQSQEVSQWIQAQREDPVIKEQIKQGKNSKFQISKAGLMYRSQKGRQQIIVPKSLQTDILKKSHDDPLSGHQGIHRTIEQLSRHYYWKQMHQDVKEYVRSCPTCQQMKSQNRAKSGLLQPIPIPERKWQQITTDLVTDLPESNGCTAIAVFVDRLTKMVHFTPCTKEITAPEYAKILIDTVLRLHGVPEIIISDRDPRFTSIMWKEFFKILGTNLRYSTAFHPQTDGQSEVTIRVLENFLRPYVERHPEKWTDVLPLMEFAANNSVNASTGFSPFYLNFGIHPISPLSMLTSSQFSTNETTNSIISHMKTALEEAQRNLHQAQIRNIRQANKSRRSEEFTEGDQVLLSTRNLRNFDVHLPIKLRRRWTGPFSICKKISPVAYALELPPGWKIHSTFHVSNLRRYYTSQEFVRTEQPPPPILIEDHLEYEVEAILRHRGQGRHRRYLVMWKGYPLTEATWEPLSSFTHSQDILQDYLRRIG